MRMHVIGPIVRLMDPGESRHEKDPFRAARKKARKFSTHDIPLLFILSTSTAGTRKTFIFAL